MNVFFRLLKIYLASVFNFKNIKMQIQKKVSKNGESVTKISKVKMVGIIFLFILIGAELIFFYGFYVFSLYKFAKAMNNIKLLFEMSVFITSFFSLLFGFLLTVSTYYIGEIEERFLSMPIKPRLLFASKFTANYINSLITSVTFFAVLMVIYGMFEKPHFLFYIWSFVCAVLVPLPIISFCYFFNIVLMNFTGFFKNKNVIMIMSSAVGVILSLALNYFFQSLSHSNNFAVIENRLETASLTLSEYGKFIYLPIKLAGKILAYPASMQAVFNLFLFIIISTAFPAVLILFMSKMYLRSLVGFGEKKIKKLNSSDTQCYIKKNMRMLPSLLSYVKREVIIMNRTPAFLLNGPFLIIFLPVLFIVIFAAKGINFNSIPDGFFNFMHTNAGFVIAGLIAAFLGAMSNVADTALSRDAKFILMIKSLPINLKNFMYAKFIHAMMFSVFAIFVGVGIISYIFKFTVLNIIFASLVAISFSGLLNLIALFLDTANPKLHWENPVAAMKQNSNVLFITFFNFIIFGLSGGILYLSVNAYTWVLLVYFIFIPSALFSILIKPYGVYAEKKLSSIEI